MRFYMSDQGPEVEYESALEARAAADDANREAVQYGQWPTACAYIKQTGRDGYEYTMEIGDIK